jgi:hypothetical protein
VPFKPKSIQELGLFSVTFQNVSPRRDLASQGLPKLEVLEQPLLTGFNQPHEQIPGILFVMVYVRESAIPCGENPWNKAIFLRL